MLARPKRLAKRSWAMAKGFVHYYRDPSPGKGWGGPFNGQAFRCQLFDALTQLKFAAIIETGSFFGTTTDYFAKTGLPVFSVEHHPKYYGFLRARFLLARKVRLRLGDSRFHLRRILARLGGEIREKPLFFYLDAHWHKDLPLAKELDIILKDCAQPIIMIDDFEVPDDSGYGFDQYGDGKDLVRDYIEPFIVHYNLSLFYPAAHSSEETGMKRGCAILVKPCTKELLMPIAQLRFAAT